MKPVRQLLIIFGDQLDSGSRVLDRLDPARDSVWMAEVAGEAEHVPSHKARIAVFLAAMRHFRDALRERGLPVRYVRLDDRHNRKSLAGQLRADLPHLRPERIIATEPGEWRVREELSAVAEEAGIPLEILTDPHFLTTQQDFAGFARGRKVLRMEDFYRRQRKHEGILMEEGAPAGGSWNFDRENRGTFSARGPGDLPRSPDLENDAVTEEVLDLVATRFPDHPGGLERFAWPVTPNAARRLLDEFVEHRLPLFGRYQDAMWTGEPFLYHSRLSVALNLKLIDPRTVIEAAERAWREGHAPLASVEGFIRQVLGWREFVRGIYWHAMPGYLQSNVLDAHRPLPWFYWTGETGMTCLRECIGQTLAYGYAHHIQRLMVTGLFSLLLGVAPRLIHEWYLAIYVDAVEWVELPNVVGMSQYADGGLLASKPYVASGRYIQRMSNYCKGCRYDPGKATEDDACPFTTLYWDFLMRHEKRLAGNHRMGFQLRNLRRLDADRRRALQKRARHVANRVDEL